MSQPAPRRCSVEEYWAIELASPVRHELLDGTIYAMAGGTARHNEVASNVHVALARAFARGPCRPLGSDQRLRVGPSRYTYADVSLFCGPVEIAQGTPPDTATNPSVVVEVLSDSTREYDCTEKLTLYQGVPSVKEVLLIEPEQVLVVRWRRDGPGWVQEAVTDPEGKLSVLGRTLRMKEVYARRIT